MGYISTEQVKAIRTEIKKSFPEYKFSITREHSSTIRIIVLSGPIELEKGEFNYYHPDQTKCETTKRLCKSILNIVHKNAEIKYHETGDYGTQPNYYAYIYVGYNDKPYICNENKKSSYCKDQFARLKNLEVITISVSDFDGNKTNYMGLSTEVIDCLIDLLIKQQK